MKNIDDIKRRVADDIDKMIARTRVRRTTGDRRQVNRSNHKQIDRRSGEDRRNRNLNMQGVKL